MSVADRLGDLGLDVGFDLDVDAMDLLRYAITVVIAFVALAPPLYALSVSFRPQSEVFGPVHLIPHNPTVDPWVNFLADAGQNLLNSLIIATGVSLISLLIAVPGAYAFARKEFHGRRMIFYTIIFIILVPVVMLVVPVVSIARDLGVYNTVSGVWLALMIAVMPASIWILRDNFQKLPPNAEEAAMVYGTTQFGAFVRVILPLATPAIVAVAFLNFLGAWNEFLFTNLLTTDTGPKPAIVVLFGLLNEDTANPWPYIMAATFIIGIPPAVFYLAARSYLAKALEF
jgi:multiple sugar transport system permease protein